MQIHTFWQWFYSVGSCQSFINASLEKKHLIRIKSKINEELTLTITFWNFFVIFFIRCWPLGRDVEQQDWANRKVQGEWWYQWSNIRCSHFLAILSLWSSIFYNHLKKDLPPASVKPKTSLDHSLWLQLALVINITLVLSACHKREAQSSSL